MAFVLFLTACIPPDASIPPARTAEIIASQAPHPLPYATNTAVQERATPNSVETPSATSTFSPTDLILSTIADPRPTGTPLPPFPTPIVYDCSAELDLTRADFNQLFTNMKAFLDGRNEAFINLIAPFETLAATHTTTPVIDETQMAQMLGVYKRWEDAAYMQPCRITGVWVSAGGQIAVRISENPSSEDRRMKKPFQPYPAWLIIYDLSTLRPVWIAEYPQGLLNLQWSPSGQQAAVLGGDQGIDILEAGDGSVSSRLSPPQPLISRCDVGYPEDNFAWDADGQHIVRKMPGKIETWDTKTGSPVSEVPFDDNATSPAVAAGDALCFVHLSWSPGARYLITTDFGQRTSDVVNREVEPPTKIWDAQTGALVRTLTEKYSEPLWNSADLLYQYVNDGDLEITKALTGEPFDQQFLMGVTSIDPTMWSPDGEKIAFSSVFSLTIYHSPTKQLGIYDYPRDITDPNFITWLPNSSQVMIIFNQNFEPQEVYLFDIDTWKLSGPGIR